MAAPRGAKKKPFNTLSPKDRTMTTTHLADTVEQNSKHASVHTKEVVAQARLLKDPRADSIKHNAEHALKHVKEVTEHARKINQHLKKYPGARSTMDELQGKPSRTPGPPGKKRLR